MHETRPVPQNFKALARLKRYLPDPCVGSTSRSRDTVRRRDSGGNCAQPTSAPQGLRSDAPAIRHVVIDYDGPGIVCWQ